ncbi:MAG TPA: FHA domain-containing protein, partial [Acidimicrobiales bacterium]|nr:FHA domain-containing protein [Acidimicrobiales bacterium]
TAGEPPPPPGPAPLAGPATDVLPIVPAPGGDLTPLSAADATIVVGAEVTTALPTAAALGSRPAGTVGLLPPPAAPAPDTPSGGRPAVPVVRGVRCRAGHFTHPAATRCVRCEQPVDEPDRVVSGPRPPLGVLVVDDGGVWPLDGAYLLGADPARDPGVTGGTARALAVPGDRVDPVHAELRCLDWAVHLVDRGSRGGTFVLAPGAADWQQLPAYRSVEVRPGTHVAVGSRVVTFLSPWPG